MLFLMRADQKTSAPETKFCPSIVPLEGVGSGAEVRSERDSDRVKVGQKSELVIENL